MVTNRVTLYSRHATYRALFLSRIFQGRAAMGRLLVSAVAGFVFAVVCAGMALGRHDEAISVVYATDRCPLDQLVRVDGGAAACLVRIAR